MKKIAITGPESCGKTSLCQALAQHYSVNWAKEYAREYLSNLDRPYEQFDLDFIAIGQQSEIDSVSGVGYLFSDTEMLVMKIWSEYKFGSVSEVIQILFENQKFDLYILCDTEIPYEFDVLRENPENRKQLFELYKNELEQMNVPYTTVTGTASERLSKAIEQINLL